MQKLNIEEITEIKNNFPEIKNNPDGNAVISHLLQIQEKTLPFANEDLSNKVRKKYIRKNEIKIQSSENLKFIDLFAGIGGFHNALSNLGCECVFASEIDAEAKKTYFKNYGLFPYGDINKLNVIDIPNHDILCAGFPCQPFSLAGISKKNSMGVPTGFKDLVKGNLFFNVRDIIREKRPRAFFLENVKNLKSHDKGKTWEIIYNTLEKELDYTIFYKIVDGKNWVPQHRERIFIVGFDSKLNLDLSNFIIPTEPLEGKCYKYKYLSQIIEKEELVDPKFTIGPGTWRALQAHKARHKAKGNGFGFNLLSSNLSKTDITSTISARYYKDGAEILIPQSTGKRPRRLTVQEAMQLQGLDPKKFSFPVSNNQAYKQIGNSVVVPAIKDTAENIIKVLNK